MKISAILITKNEEKNISTALNSIIWCDEVIVIDTGSRDKTVQIAQKFGAKVYHFNKGSFSDWRNFGVKKALGEWLLYVDADEQITSLLRDEISQLVNKSINQYSAYAIPRKNILLGHEMKWGGWWPDYVLRLIRKSSFKGYEGELHEQPKILGEIGYLKNPLIHISHESLDQMVEKTNNWSEIEAKLLFKSGHPKMNIPRFLTAMFREFWYRGILKLCFLDGPIGIIEIIYQVFSRFVTYAKLWEMQIKNESRNL